MSAEHALLEVRRGDPTSLQRLVRALEDRFGGVLGALRLDSFGDLPAGSLVVLRATLDDAPSLNLSRPALLHHRLRVVLFAEGEEAGPFRRAAPDLASWIQQSFEPEPEPAPYAVAGIRRARRGGGIGVEWRGGDLEATLLAAGEAIAGEVDGSTKYEVLIDQLRAMPPGLVRVTGDDVDVPRLGWALAEAGREEDAIRVGDGSPGWWQVGGEPIGWEQAAQRLPGPRGAVLAALLGGEREAIEVAARRLEREDVEELIRLAKADDPGAALASAPAVPFAGLAPQQRADDGARWDAWAATRIARLEQEGPEDGEIAAIVAVTTGPQDLSPAQGCPRRWVDAAGALVRPGAGESHLEQAAWLALDAGRLAVAAVWAARLVARLEGRGEKGAAWASALHLLARVRLAEGDHARAGVVIEEALAAWPVGGDHLGRATLVETRGRIRMRAGDLEGARRDLDEVVAVAEASSGSERLLARALAGRAWVLRDQNRGDEARAAIERAIAIARGFAEPDLLLAMLLRRRGVLRQEGGALPDARTDLEAALEILGRAADRDDHPDGRLTLRCLASVMRALGDLEAARRDLVALRAIEARADDPARLAAVLREFAAVEVARGDLFGAREALEERVKLCRGPRGRAAVLPAALWELAQVRLAQGDEGAARALLTEALGAQRQLGPGARSHREAEIAEALGQLLIRAGDVEAGGELVRGARGIGGEALRRNAKGANAMPPQNGHVKGDNGGPEEALRRIERCRLAGTAELNLDGLGLAFVPEALRELSQLQELSLERNHLAALPAWLTELRGLRKLWLTDNPALSAGGLEVRPLRALEALDIAGTATRDLPAGFGELPRLRSLGLDRLGLRCVPPELELCQSLRMVWLRNNDLHDLPRGLGELPLRLLDLSGNPRLGLPPALVAAAANYQYSPKGRGFDGSPAVQALLTWYFRSRERDGRPLDEVKLLLVGRGESGKTAVRNRLLHDRFRKTKETRGIDIESWTLPVGDHDVKVNVWDFAGQTITHATHQFFLTERSVYVLLLTGRGDTQKSDADYWLRLIQAFGTDADGRTSPVVVALNKWEEHPFKLDRNALREKYPFIVDFVETDNKSGLGIPALRKHLADAIDRIESVRMPFPAAWWNIKERLEQIQGRKSWIPWSEFQEVCAELGERTTGDQDALARVLHALGIALNYADDPRLHNATVLNPRWVTDSIYRVLREATSEVGELTLADVQRVLPREKADMRRYLVELMRRFDLAFPLSDADDRWLVPQRLPEEQPELGPEWRATTATRLRFRYSVLPEGLLPRFITRTWPLSASGTAADSPGGPLPRWMNGVILEDAGARALVRADREEREVSVVVIGDPAARPPLLAVIRAELGKIHADIPGLHPREEILTAGGEGWVPVSTLRADEEHGRSSSAATDKGTITLSPTTELDRLSDAAGRDPHRWRARVFLSYSSRDARLRDELLMRLKPLEVSRGLVSTWSDRCLTPGEPWDRRIRQELEQADVILVLVSASLLANDYVRDVELQRAVARAEAGEALLVPVFLERCDWEGEALARFTGLPSKARPIRDWKPQANGIHEVVVGLRKLLEDLQQRRGPVLDARRLL